MADILMRSSVTKIENSHLGMDIARFPAHLASKAEGCPDRGTDSVAAGASVPPGRLTLNTNRFEPPLLGTRTKFPSRVIPPETGFAVLILVETLAGDNAVSALVLGL